MSRRNRPFFFAICLLIISTLLNLALDQFKAKQNLKELHEIRSKLALIPQSERNDLEHLFRHLIFRSSFAYVLFGDKPMAFETLLSTQAIWRQYMHLYSRFEAGLNFFKYQRGWETWERYKHLFPIENFILVQQNDLRSPSTTSIFLINKQAFLSTISHHNQDFVKVLGKDVNPRKLMESFYKKTNTFDENIKHHPALLGILLGYGKGNSWHYWQMGEFRKKTKKQHISISPPGQSRANFVPVFEEPNLDLGCPIFPPMFMCDPETIETKKLRKKYRQQRIAIYKEYQDKDFLEVTLLQLTKKS